MSISFQHVPDEQLASYLEAGSAHPAMKHVVAEVAARLRKRGWKPNMEKLSDDREPGSARP